MCNQSYLEFMMLKHYFYLLLLVMTGRMLVSCHVDKSLVNSIDDITDMDVRKAMMWFDKFGQVDTFTSLGNAVPLFVDMVPVWSMAWKDSTDRFQTVEIPIRSYSRALYTLPENEIAYERTKNSKYIQSLAHLVILTDKQEKKTNGFFMILVPSKKYMDARNFDVYGSTYLYRATDFDGYIYFHELDGSFANGWRYTDGKITHKVHKGKKVESDEEIKKCYPVYRQVCPDFRKRHKMKDRNKSR